MDNYKLTGIIFDSNLVFLMCMRSEKVVTILVRLEVCFAENQRVRNPAESVFSSGVCSTMASTLGYSRSSVFKISSL